MSLKITSLELASFRNYDSFRLDPGERLTVLVGPNATGKTNVVEAIQLLTAARSFRNPQWAEIVKWGADRARLTMTAKSDDRSLQVALETTSAGRRTYRVNGTVRRKISEVAGVLPSVLFTPDDLRMVKESADRRRAALDALGEQLSPAYATIGTEYDRVLRQRNALLKEDVVSQEALDAWTERLVEVGSSLAVHRARLFERLAPAMSGVYATLSHGETLAPSYHSSIRGAESACGNDRQALAERFKERLLEKSSEERARRTTAVGPHRDDVTFEIDGRDARAFGSQGQQRTIALAWKLAEVHVVEEVTGGEPVLLLDDVMSELDEARRTALAAFVGERVQTIITTTNLGYFNPMLLEAATLVKLP